MPFNGTGTYSPPALPVFPPAPGDVISSSYYTQVINDISTALSQTFLRTGTATLSGDIKTNANIQFDTGDILSYDRGNNRYIFSIATSPVLSVNATGIAVGNSTGIAGTATAGYVGVVVGDATHTGRVELYNTAGVRQGYFGNATTNGNINFLSDTGNGFFFTGGNVRSNNIITADLGFSAGVTANGIVKLLPGDTTHTGSISFINASNVVQGYIGTTLTNGPLNIQSSTSAGVQLAGGPIAFLDANFTANLFSGNPGLQFDAGPDMIWYDRTNNKWYWFVNSVAVMSLDSAGNIRATGTITGGVAP